MRYVMRLGEAAVLAAGLMLLVSACAAVEADPQSEVNEALKAARIDHVPRSGTGSGTSCAFAAS